MLGPLLLEFCAVLALLGVSLCIEVILQALDSDWGVSVCSNYLFVEELFDHVSLWCHLLFDSVSQLCHEETLQDILLI